MRQFVYISTAARLQPADIDAILASSQRNNERAGITGFLLYNGRNFMQMIEGKQVDLLSLMSRLASDQRHSGMVRLHDEPIEERHCPEWAMHSVHLSDDMTERRTAINNEIPCTVSPEIQRLVNNFASLN